MSKYRAVVTLEEIPDGDMMGPVTIEVTIIDGSPFQSIERAAHAAMHSIVVDEPDASPLLAALKGDH